jgi:O-antigen ligase
MIFAALIFAAALLVLALKDFKRALQCLIFLLPTYLLRFKIGPLPSTFLELAFGIVFLVWLFRYFVDDIADLIQSYRRQKSFFTFVAVFFVGSFISIFISDMRWFSFGQWRAYFLEPMLLFMVLIGRRNNISTRDLVLPLGLSTLGISVFGIFQKLTGFTLPDDGRMTSFYTSPNTVGLYLAPALLLFVSETKNFFSSNNKYLKALPYFVFALAALAVLFSGSLGTMVGLGAATILLLTLFHKKQIAAGLIVIALCAAFVVPSTRNFVTSKDRSSGNRLTLWTYSWEYLTSSPKNFVFGTGVRQFFRKIQKPEYNPKQMERLIYPHNIFLNFWTETGLIGLIGFVGIFAYLSLFSWRILQGNRLVGAACLGALAVILVHGLVDVPYFKNDLSMMFWIIAAIILNERTRLV